MHALSLFVKVIIVIVFVGGLVGFTPPLSPNATISVTTFVDEYADPGPGTGCSLREAITAANTDTAFGGCVKGLGTDTVQLDIGTYVLSIAGTNEDANVTGDLDITAAIMLHGSDSGTTIIDGGDIDRVIDSRITTTIHALTVTNGRTVTTDSLGGKGGGIYTSTWMSLIDVDVTYNETGDGANNGGGGIYNAGNLTLTNVEVSHNSVGSGNTIGCGGGIFVFDAYSGITSLTINSSTISDNSCGSVFKGNDTIGGNGGGIFQTGSDVTVSTVDVVINDSTISGNHAANGTDAEAGSGGGIFVNAQGSQMQIDQSLVYDNHAGDNLLHQGGNGGGIAVAYTSVLDLRNSTISGNYAGDSADDTGKYGGYGGGISMEGYMQARFTTIANNHTGSGASCANGCSGGGVYAEPAYGHTDLGYSIVADNVSARYGPDCFGSAILNWSLIQDDTDCTISGSDNLMDVNALLSPLAFHGGLTQTHALYPGSPAIDSIQYSTYTVDQRGITRPQDGDQDGAAWFDMGAFEASFVFRFIPMIIK